MKRVSVLALVILTGAGVLLRAQALKVDPGLPPYQKTSGVSGNLNSIGSDTMNNMMTLWAETFRKF